MQTLTQIDVRDVQAVYDGAEGDFWELVMGEQIHVGGLSASKDLAERARIAPATIGVDLCCCSGAGMRFLVRFFDVGHVIGVDVTQRVVDRGRLRTRAEGLTSRIDFVVADATASGLASASADFVSAEDAWCYVADKALLVREAARIVRRGGTVAFTDWIAGPEPMTDEEATRLLRFMKLPNIVTLDEYRSLLDEAGCDVETARYTGRFAGHVDLYVDMLTMQLTYDALKLIDFDLELMQALGAELAFLQRLAHQAKVSQGQFVARRR